MIDINIDKDNANSLTANKRKLDCLLDIVF